jgi:protein gp37
MGENSKIKWCDHTFNPWIGCQKVSLADVFDNQVVSSWRDDLFGLIRECNKLDWLVLTKRPENIQKMLPSDWRDGYSNVWLGTTAEDQTGFDMRWKRL